MSGPFDALDAIVVSIILLMILAARFGGWGRGFWPPRGPFSD